jgi:hypothetical protein
MAGQTWRCVHARASRRQVAASTCPSSTTWLCVSDSGLSSSGFMRTSGAAPAASAWKYCAAADLTLPHHPRVVAHVLRLERRHPQALAGVVAAQRGGQPALAGAAGGAQHHHTAGDAVVEHLLQRAVRGRIGAGALPGHLALRQDHQFVGVQRQRDFMQHADHRAPAGDQLAHHAQPVGLVRQVEVGQGFVHEQHLRLHGQRARQQHTLALATGELAQRALAPVPGLRGAQRLLHRGVVGRAGRRQPGLVREATEHGDVPGAQVFGRAFALPEPGQLPGPLPARQGLHRRAEQPHLAGVRQQPAQRLEQRGFARAVGPDDAGPAPGRQGQVEPV